MPALPFPDAEDELIATRLEKLRALREAGLDPFAVEKFERTNLAADVSARFDDLEGTVARMAGRVVAIRVMGKAQFMHIEDGSGRIQIYLKKDTLGDEAYARLNLVDSGDFLGFEGEVHKTRTGEVTIFVSSYQVLSKALRPLPFGKQTDEGKEYGTLVDVEERHRHRHLDLAVHPEVRERFRQRSAVVSSVRKTMERRGYMEVETPVLQRVAGGAAARPFRTHHNALNADLNLRISLELELKRLIIGGFERVYEIGRVFRNEGISTRHNPEFTLMECYEAYANLEDVMGLVEDVYSSAAMELYGEPSIPYGEGRISVAPPWRRLPLLEGIEQYAGVKPSEFETLESSLRALEAVGLPTEGEHLVGGIIEKFLERFVQPNLKEPTFITNYPLETSPLAKKHPDNPKLVRRFEAYIALQEVGNAFSELNDPVDQWERFAAQADLRAGGDEEAHPMDTEFVKAMTYGMPPTGGLGLGIDRMVMVLTDTASVRDVILFPQMKPEGA
ncbi:MAG TPA: lysine--tRNA ligase [Armatimonadota bacterium]|jgi:lysyl-tRNA synthetase class 2